ARADGRAVAGPARHRPRRPARAGPPATLPRPDQIPGHPSHGHPPTQPQRAAPRHRRDREVMSETTTGQMSLAEVCTRAGEVLDRVEQAVVGKLESLTLVLTSILSRGHVLLEDFPGLGKTLAARSFAQTLGLDFTRAQFTPDLLPSDLTGSFVYDQKVS